MLWCGDKAVASELLEVLEGEITVPDSAKGAIPEPLGDLEEAGPPVTIDDEAIMGVWRAARDGDGAGMVELL
jgi:hypothetical protein